MKQPFAKHLIAGSIIARMLRRTFRLMLAVPLAVAGTMPAAAPAAAADQDAVRAGVASGQYKSLGTILGEIHARYPGRVVDVETKRGPGGELRYEIKVIDGQGGKQELLIDAATDRTLDRTVTDRAQALPMAELARHLARIGQQHHDHRIIDVEFERDRDGRGVYLIKLSPLDQGDRKLVMDAATGRLLASPEGAAAQVGAVRRVDEVLLALDRTFGGRVLEVELEHEVRQRPYYEIELLQANGSTLELKVDAQTLRVLQQKVED